MLRILILLAVFAFESPARAADRNEIVMGFSPAENAGAMENKSRMLEEYFLKKTGMKVKSFIATDYTALVEALRSGTVDFAWLPPFSFVQAEKIAGAQVLLKVVRHGRSSMYSAVIARADKGFKSIDDLKGRTIAWVDVASATGHVIPKASLVLKKKMDPDSFFKSQIFAGSHDAVVLAVVNGSVDSGATWCNDPKGTDGSWHLYLKDKSSQIKVLFMSEAIPSDTVTTSSKFASAHKDIVDKTIKALLAMTKDKEGAKILKELYGIDDLAPANAKEYEIIRKAAQVTGISK